MTEVILTTPGLPAIGTFLLPGNDDGDVFEYCIRVVQQFPNDATTGARIEYERWGVRDGHPFDDGYVARGRYMELAPESDDVWRDPFDFGGYPRWSCCPQWYRRMRTEQSGQQALF